MKTDDVKPDPVSEMESCWDDLARNGIECTGCRSGDRCPGCSQIDKMEAGLDVYRAAVVDRDRLRAALEAIHAALPSVTRSRVARQCDLSAVGDGECVGCANWEDGYGGGHTEDCLWTLIDAIPSLIAGRHYEVEREEE